MDSLGPDIDLKSEEAAQIRSTLRNMKTYRRRALSMIGKALHHAGAPAEKVLPAFESFFENVQSEQKKYPPDEEHLPLIKAGIEPVPRVLIEVSSEQPGRCRVEWFGEGRSFASDRLSVIAAVLNRALPAWLPDDGCLLIAKSIQDIFPDFEALRDFSGFSRSISIQFICDIYGPAVSVKLNSRIYPDGKHRERLDKFARTLGLSNFGDDYGRFRDVFEKRATLQAVEAEVGENLRMLSHWRCTVEVFDDVLECALKVLGFEDECAAARQCTDAWFAEQDSENFLNTVEFWIDHLSASPRFGVRRLVSPRVVQKNQGQVLAPFMATLKNPKFVDSLLRDARRNVDAAPARSIALVSLGMVFETKQARQQVVLEPLL